MSNYKCLKCGYEWIARVLTAPKQCPKCKSYAYMKENTTQINKMEKIKYED